MEQWKEIDGFKVSNLGNYEGETRIHQGYLQFKGTDAPYVHIVIAKAFCNWFNGCHIHHINGNKLDNRAENLICLTPSEHQLAHREQKVELGKVLFLGKHHTEEAKEKMRIGHIGKPLKEEHKQKIKAALSIKVGEYDLDGNLIKIWDCINDAQKYYNDYHISEVCRGKRKTAAKRIWRYIDD